MMFCFFSLLLLSILAITSPVCSQQPSSEGFISIDCGSNNSNYLDPDTNLAYASDAGFIDAGTNFQILPAYVDSYVPTQALTVRSFPDELRNCYTLKPVSQNHIYLVRATFMYGNYDGKNSQLKFDLHIGVNRWATVTISEPSTIYTEEALHVPQDDFISVCLIDTKSGTPFISSLELRPLADGDYKVYVNASQSLVLVGRVNFGVTYKLRYPDDPYDRIWRPMNSDDWTPLSTDFRVDNSGDTLFKLPSLVMETAATPTNGWKMEFGWYTSLPSEKFFGILHFAELQELPSNESREFDIYLDGKFWYGPYVPSYLLAQSVRAVASVSGSTGHDYTLTATTNSTLPPIINAAEVYSLMNLTEVTTDAGDVDAILEIKSQYKIRRNWMGDPCAPKAYTWDGLTCNYTSVDAPTIIYVNLASGGLNGEISKSFAMLKALKYLDLSCNNLSGKIPESLGDLLSFEALDLTGTNLDNGSVPDSLQKKVDAKSLTLRLGKGNCVNQTSAASSNNNEKNKRFTITLSVSISVPVVTVGAIITIFKYWQGRRAKLVPDEEKSKKPDTSTPEPKNQGHAHGRNEDNVSIANFEHDTNV